MRCVVRLFLLAWLALISAATVGALYKSAGWLGARLQSLHAGSVFGPKNAIARVSFASYAKGKQGKRRENDQDTDEDPSVSTTTSAPISPNLSIEQAAKIKAEIASPFRLFRQFIYGGAGAAGALGTFTALPQLVFALQDGGDKVGPAVGNIAIDLGALVGAVLLWRQESKIGAAKVERFTEKERRAVTGLSDDDARAREAELALLPVEIVFSDQSDEVTRTVSFADLQARGNQNVVVVAGPLEFVRDCILSARVAGTDLFNTNNVYIVPVVLGGGGREDLLAEQLAETEAAGSKGFGAAKLDKASLLGQSYIGRPTSFAAWERYLEKEVRAAEQQGAKNILKEGLVLGIDKTGRVVRRGVGAPPWKTLIPEICRKK